MSRMALPLAAFDAKGLVAHLRQYPGQADLQGLAAARESLTAFAEHPGLVKIEEERP